MQTSQNEKEQSSQQLMGEVLLFSAKYFAFTKTNICLLRQTIMVVILVILSNAVRVTKMYLPK